MDDAADTSCVRLKPERREEAMETSQRIRTLHYDPVRQENNFNTALVDL